MSLLQVAAFCGNVWRWLENLAPMGHSDGAETLKGN